MTGKLLKRCVSATAVQYISCDLLLASMLTLHEHLVLWHACLGSWIYRCSSYDSLVNVTLLSLSCDFVAAAAGTLQHFQTWPAISQTSFMLWNNERLWYFTLCLKHTLNLLCSCYAAHIFMLVLFGLDLDNFMIYIVRVFLFVNFSFCQLCLSVT